MLPPRPLMCLYTEIILQHSEFLFAYLLFREYPDNVDEGESNEDKSVLYTTKDNSVNTLTPPKGS